jgi:DNA-binding Xre family transcriptional regulator
MTKQIRYNKLWKMLVDKKMSKGDLRKEIGLAPNTLTKLRRDEEVALSVLIRICEHLDCDIGDIMELVTVDETSQNVAS